MSFIQYMKYKRGGNFVRVCTFVCKCSYIYMYTYFLLLMPTLLLSQATTCQYGPTEHVQNERAVRTNVMGYNGSHEYNDGM